MLEAHEKKMLFCVIALRWFFPVEQFLQRKQYETKAKAFTNAMNLNRHFFRTIGLFSIIWLSSLVAFGQSGNVLTNTGGSGWNKRILDTGAFSTTKINQKTLLVKFKTGTTVNISKDVSGIVYTGIPAVDILNEQYQCTYIKKDYKGVTPKMNWDNELSHTFRFADEIDIPTAISDYLATGYFEHVLKDQQIDISFEHLNKTTIVPNDTYFADQWALENDSVTAVTNFGVPAVVDADIDMADAWNCEQGDTNVVVAVMGTGILLTHPEFLGRIWTNHDEIPNDNTDNDGNGFDDDVNGWDFFDTDNDPTDTDGHETSMASIIGANGNNNDGIAGIDWNCRLMPVRIADESTTLSASILRDGIIYATENGADVINFSASYPQNDTTIRNAIYYAYTNDIVFTAAIGNSNANIDFYPAAYDDSVGVLAVGATGADDKRVVINASAGSTYSNNIDVVAPGDNIISLDHQLNIITNGGTSEATAHVSGLAALLKAQDTTRTADTIIAIIKATAEDQVGRPTEDTQGFDIYHGHGRINAERALCSPNSIGESQYIKANIDLFPNPTSGTVTAYIHDIQARDISIRVFDVQGRLVDSQEERRKQQIEIHFPNDSGMYLVEIIVNGMYRTSEKILKQSGK